MFPIYGIAATATPDRVGEQLDIAGADISNMRNINDEHSKGCFATLGSISKAKKIFKETDCADIYEKRCWDKLRKPFIYIYGNLTDDGHPNALAAQSLIKFARQNPSFKIGLSVEGGTLKKEGPRLLKTIIKGASLTVNPCNSECNIWPVDDLMKSNVKIELPEIYKNVESRRSFRELPSDEQRMEAKIELLRKSTQMLNAGTIGEAALVKCWSCGEGKLFMKSRLPNVCTACKSPFSMSDIFNALQSHV